jgi:hypothetical protein
MNYFRYHWFDVAAILAALLGITLYVMQPSGMSMVLWLSLGSLFLHQVEEWRYPGYFPGMLNTAMFNSDIPDRYPLNANNGMIVNVFLGWGSYLLAALFWQQAIWLAIATVVVSVGNVVAHTIIFNIKGKTLYNPGLLTSWLCFVPITYFFCQMVISQQLATSLDWLMGVTLGILFCYFGIYKLIIWLADRSTSYTFSKRFLK